ncbi:hypothetical protein [Parerythrobacter jejuensis]|uniref:5-bromo-4-chloroindolyl phosphate hydrolysis protein n=1 Tax=Parerythrobacter jejuensis TaxID=795812 RepID=A0A845B553_9SPHN|nr:hypothetical protein [Parerythrobacter jejuensis]MXP31338.1 hypothetical protein [Parerythrobacter jejuensis]MXP34098.1 hypothetical protein [Parerythrobacter jejuensis]
MSDEYKSYSRHSDRIMEDARRVRDDNRGGGRHRREGSIGKGSKKLKWKHLKKKGIRMAMAVGAIWLAASVLGVILDGIGFEGVMAAGLATALGVYVFGKYPKMKVPQRPDLLKGDERQMVARTELWLEHQRDSLPRAAQPILQELGGRLDALGQQLAKVPAEHETARDIRKLVGETLPEMVDSYKKIPDHIRTEKRGNSSPAEQITQGLQKISNEIDSITRQLAQGSIDDLAITHRYLDYKYGEAIDGDQDSGVPLPDFDLDKSKAPG